jgi:hypothetical protein
MPTLTKSLHTVTATVNVARLILSTDPRIGQRTLAGKALETLGYDIDAFPSDDPTVAKVMQGCGKLIRESVGDWRAMRELAAFQDRVL